MTIKVLKLEAWMKYEAIRKTENLIACNRVFNRDGYYYNTRTKKCWFEADGDAFNGTYSSFLYSLEMLNHRPLRKIERDAVEVLIQSKLASKEQQNILRRDDVYLEIKQLSYNTKKFLKRFAKNRKTLT